MAVGAAAVRLTAGGPPAGGALAFVAGRPAVPAIDAPAIDAPAITHAAITYAAKSCSFVAN